MLTLKLNMYNTIKCNYDMSYVTNMTVMCRICLNEPETDRNIELFDIFSPNNKVPDLEKALLEFINLKV